MKRILLNLLIPALLVLSGCSNDCMSPSESFRWIAAYSRDMVDPDAVIRIEPTDSLKKLLCNENDINDAFRFTPRVKGTARFSSDGRFIDFHPENGGLKEGKEYECRVRMSRLTSVDSLADFAFRFRVVKREVKMDEVAIRINPKNVEEAILTGKLVFSHPAGELSADNNLLVCSDKKAIVNISRTENDRILDFVISGIGRNEEDHTVSIRYSPLSSSQKINHEIAVPGLKDFKLLSAEDVESSEPYINLQFTEQLDTQQDLDGLITMERGKIVKIERHGVSARVFYNASGLTRYVLDISDMVRSADGQYLKAEVSQEFLQEMIPPAIEVPMSGTILPDGRNLVFPFKAVNLAAVDVEVVKIYADNMLHYLQDCEIDDCDYMRRAGRLIYKKTIRLDQDKSLDLHKWQNFSINLKGLFKQERAAVYNVRLMFRKAYSLYDRDEPADFQSADGISEEDEKEWDKTYSYIYRQAPDLDWREYSWKEQDDPSKDSYYMVSNRMPEYNLLASNLGIIVKKSDDRRIWTTVSDIMTAAPLSGVKVTAYNYQLREVGSGWTDSRGFADFQLSGKPFIVTATDGVSVTYLKVAEGGEKSTSFFDVSGKKNTGSIKGYTYGDRGIWRPGDDIHLTLIIEDKNRTLPSNHPVNLMLYTPDEVLYCKKTLTKGVNGFYTFQISTDEDVKTGRWTAEFHVGSTVFKHKVPIETIKPNRLKINMNLPEVLSSGSNIKAEIDVAWLTGVVAKGLKTELEVTLYNNDKPFKDYPKYRFSNPLLKFTESDYTLGSGTLDSLGHTTLDVQMPEQKNAPGMLQANFVCKVTENGGDESITSRSMRFSPFSSYVGVDLSQEEYETDKDLCFPVVTLDAEGKRLSGRRLEWKIYELQWQWWWEGSAEELTRYVNGKSAEIVASGEVIAKDGVAEIPFRVDYPSYGCYLVFVRDVESNHATGGKVCVDWPQWRGRTDRAESQGVAILSFSMDKDKYEAGETATVYLPKSAGGRVLLSFENGSRVISRQWVTLSKDKETGFRFKVNKEMSPNFYLHATLLQPHDQTLNDHPIRMYGIDGAEVVDKTSILHPLIDAPDAVQPQKEFRVKVSEQNGRPMTYTLAIVDEGLLDINGFKTPNAWRTMNMREALGVNTWDIYDHVIGAYAGKFTSVLSIGGDMALRAAAGKEKRFNPIVKFMGPFTTNGSSRTHKITLPMYVGSVRVMLVAGQDGAYGSAEKNITVKSPLMLLSTLPRVLSCGDKVNMPVNVFSTDAEIKDVDVNIAVDGPVNVVGKDCKKISFSGSGEEILDFALDCDSVSEGVAKITITAVSGTHKAKETINIQVRNPHPPILSSTHRLLEKGEAEFAWNPDYMDKVTLEVSTLPSVNFEKVYSFVCNYPHYCTEQLSARAMFLLYGRRFLSIDKQDEAEMMLRDILKELTCRQLPDGGFKYWNSGVHAHHWATSMVGEVMTEAMNQGFSIPSETYSKWIGYQVAQSKKYRHSSAYAHDLSQAYRLYTLCLAGNEQTALMNRLKESRTLSEQAAYRLAAAYHIVGKDSVAEGLLESESPYQNGEYTTFWSPLRDNAMKLETLVLLGKTGKAIVLANEIAEEFSSSSYSTQEIAFVTTAFSRLAQISGLQSSDVTLSYGDRRLLQKNMNGVKIFDIPALYGSVKIENASESKVYLSLVTQRQPSADEVVVAQSKGASVSVRYTDLSGKTIDISNLKQGEEFIAEIAVRKKDNRDSDSMALTFRVPSGWEIWNDRINNDKTGLNNIDIRDDRVSWYYRHLRVETKTFRIRLRAAYTGEYIHPGAIVEDMYNAECKASAGSGKVIVSK